jgi:hypothetical protein
MTAPTDGPPARRQPFDGRMRAALGAVAITGAGLSLGSAAVFGVATAFGVAVGGAIATANLWALARIVAALLPDDAPGSNAQSRAGWALVAMLKMLGLVAGVWLLMRHGVVSALPMLVGFGALPIGIAIGTLVSDRTPAPERP